MGPKVQKFNTPWFSCKECEAIVATKDLIIHQEGSCPPSTQSWTHGYIKDKVLYGFKEEMKSKDSIKHIPKEELNNIIFLSQSALQICDICIGDPVIVNIGSSSAIYKAWPTLEHSLISVLIPKEAIGLISNTDCVDFVSVQKLNVSSLPAKEVFLVSNNLVEIPKNLSDLLGRQYQGRMLCVGNQLTVQHYGKNLQFTIESVLPLESPECSDPVQNVTNVLSKMDIIDVRLSVFKVFEMTKWNINLGKQKEGDVEISENALSKIGGLDDIIVELQELIKLALGVVRPIAGLKVTRGILLHGVPGVGKTLLARALASSMNVNVVNINGPEIYSKYFGETEARLKDVFNAAKQRSPSIILLDDIDALCPGRSGTSDQEKRVVATLLTQLDGLHDGDRSVVVIATSRQPDNIDQALRRPGRLDRELEIPVPSPDARRDCLFRMLAAIDHRLSEADIQQVAYAAHGFVGADLASLCSRAGAQALIRNADYLTASDFVGALNIVKPSAMREVSLEVPCVRWSDIGGQHSLKLQLAQAVEWPLRHPEAFVRLGIPPPRGVLMFGPPGCSKTMIAKALATESKLNFLSIKGPELFSKWVGESERAVRAVFRRARQVAPAVVFFDELDALAGHRGAGGGSEGGSNVQERVLAQLLTELDGVEPLGNVVVVAATNRPDRIDKALLRPGRLDRVVYVPLPDGATRSEIFAIQLKKTPVAPDVDLAELVAETEGYSGAEVLAVCHEAALKALEDDLTAARVSRNNFMTALTLVTPRTSPELLQLYEDYLHK